MIHDFDEITERLLLAPCWVIDFLPVQVPNESRGQFFAVERYYLASERLCRRFADVVLRLNCYHDLTVNCGGDVWVKNPEPATLVAWLHDALQNGHLCALLDDGDAMITASGGDTHLTLHNASDGLIEQVRQLATASGLYLWQPAQ
jgi:hypothetical protein